MAKPYVSVVIPIYNEADNIKPLSERLLNTLNNLGKTYEVIFVNDGSQDNSLTLLKNLHDAHPEQIKVIDFNGNFGQHMAVVAGFELSKANYVVTLDADLQNPPEEIPNLLAKMQDGYDLVSGVRQMRKDTFFRRYASKIINLIRDRITRVDMKDHGSMLRAYGRNVVDLIVASRETSMYIPALAYNYATNPIEIDVAHEARNEGESKYSLYKLIRLNFDLMTGFSLVPLQVFTLTGFLVSFFSILFVIYMFIRRIIIGPEAQGVFTLFAILFLLIGIVLMGLGIVGEYIGRIYVEVRRRPRYAIRTIYEFKKPTVRKKTVTTKKSTTKPKE
jgi:undecaprenyl-phosphate 4-deoxy-4-formamido-L-arabinose transferase